ncbi:hypothetical protein ACIHQR_30285 [Corallococcus coralloides]|uniref:hypothetical protein n=1 Tax=Corallococcus coralloides TaxID=184914 RepID=UPI00384AD926
MEIRSWASIIKELERHPLGTRIRIESHLVEHPLDSYMRPTVSFPVGQRTDYRREVSAQRAIHVQDFGGHFEAYLHARALPALTSAHGGEYPFSGAVALCALIGMAMGRTKASSFAGALVGALLGAALENSLSATSEPPTGVATKETPG